MFVVEDGVAYVVAPWAFFFVHWYEAGDGFACGSAFAGDWPVGAFTGGGAGDEQVE